ALGMSRSQILRRIVLPQALVRMLPAFGSLLSITIKDTAIASVIAVPELMRQSETLAGQSFQPIEVYSFAMLVYFLILFPVTRGVDRIYQRVAHFGRSRPGSRRWRSTSRPPTPRPSGRASARSGAASSKRRWRSA